MSVDLVVIRGDGSRSGEDILDPMLSDVSAALARGAQEINAHTPVSPVNLTVLYRIGIRKGQTIEVTDNRTGGKWRGILIGVTHSIENAVILSRLEVERVI